MCPDAVHSSMAHLVAMLKQVATDITLNEQERDDIMQQIRLTMHERYGIKTWETN